MYFTLHRGRAGPRTCTDVPSRACFAYSAVCSRLSRFGGGGCNLRSCRSPVSRFLCRFFPLTSWVGLCAPVLEHFSRSDLSESSSVTFLTCVRVHPSSMFPIVPRCSYARTYRFMSRRAHALPCDASRCEARREICRIYMCSQRRCSRHCRSGECLLTQLWWLMLNARSCAPVG